MAEVTKEELDEINSLRGKLSDIVSDSGQLTLQIKLLTTDIKELEDRIEENVKKFKMLLDEEQAVVNRLSEKYGVGSINFETGEFTPDR